MKKGFSKFMMVLSLTCMMGVPVLADQVKSTVDADTALKQLIEGNTRFSTGKASHPHQEASRREALNQGQHPIAVVVSCSDSRVGPELVFDQGLGDLFVVRTAGNLVGDIELGSIEYAVEYLGVTLIVVEGHEKCGAVSAAGTTGHFEGHIQTLVTKVRANLSQSKVSKSASLMEAVDGNVKAVVNQLQKSPDFAKKIKSGQLKVVGCHYTLSDGHIQIL